MVIMVQISDAGIPLTIRRQKNIEDEQHTPYYKLQSDPNRIIYTIKQVTSNLACCGMQIRESIVEIVVKDPFGGGVFQARVCHVVAV